MWHGLHSWQGFVSTFALLCLCARVPCREFWSGPSFVDWWAAWQEGEQVRRLPDVMHGQKLNNNLNCGQQNTILVIV
jgi:hypothetical protein